MAKPGYIVNTQVASSTPFDNTTPVGVNFTSTDSQGAIEEAYSLAGQTSRGPTICGFDGTASTGRYLEFFSNNPSSGSPFIVAEPSQLIAVSISSSSNSTGTVTIYKNGVSITTISLSASRKARVKGLSLGLTDLDEVSASVTSGSIARPSLFLFIRTLP